MLRDELSSIENTPEYQEESAENPDQKYLFSKAFVLKVIRLTHKYHIIVHHVMTKQAEDKRLAAVEEDDLESYAKAYYTQDRLKMKISTEVEDIIFDHFCIIEQQFEAANNVFKSDAGFVK